METEGSEMSWRPTESPDVVTPAGHAFWWSRMLFMHVHGGFFELKVDQENGELYYVTKDEKKVKLPPTAKELYDKWWYEVFESKVIGDEDG
jgi:hypothetical protein